MADVRPFRGLRFDPRRVDVGAALCPPFDVMSPAEQEAYHARDPHNVVRVELGLGPADPNAAGNRYEGAAEALRAWQDEGVLLREGEPALYLHEQRFSRGGKSYVRRGVIVAGRLHPWDEGQVLPHEGTRQGPKHDRLALMRATNANASPLWLLYDDRDGAVARVLSRAWAETPALEAESDGETHTLRVVLDAAAIRSAVAAFASRPLYIADGHHRYETAQHYRDERRAAPLSPRERGARVSRTAGPGGGRVRRTRARGVRDSSDAGHEFAMMLLVALDDPGLLVLPTHRLVRGLEMSGAALREALGRWLSLEPFALSGDDAARGAALEATLDAQAGHVFGLLDGEGAWLLRPRDDRDWNLLLPDGHSDAWRALDVSVLDAIAIREVCGVRAEGEASRSDATSHAPSDRLAYVSDFEGAVRAVRAGEAQAAFLLKGTRVEQVCAVAEARDRMPPKSTFFWPKPMTGLVMHPLDGSRPLE